VHAATIESVAPARAILYQQPLRKQAARDSSKRRLLLSRAIETTFLPTIYTPFRVFGLQPQVNCHQTAMLLTGPRRQVGMRDAVRSKACGFWSLDLRVVEAYNGSRAVSSDKVLVPRRLTHM
jgi:hypothetical protein